MEEFENVLEFKFNKYSTNDLEKMKNIINEELSRRHKIEQEESHKSAIEKSKKEWFKRAYNYLNSFDNNYSIIYALKNTYLNNRQDILWIKIDTAESESYCYINNCDYGDKATCFPIGNKERGICKECFQYAEKEVLSIAMLQEFDKYISNHQP